MYSKPYVYVCVNVHNCQVESLKLPNGHDVMLAADRGYSNPEFWTTIGSRNINFIVVSKNGSRNGHAFALKTEYVDEHQNHITEAEMALLQTRLENARREHETNVSKPVTPAHEVTEFDSSESSSSDDDPMSDNDASFSSRARNIDSQTFNDTDSDTLPMVLPAHVVDNSASLGPQILFAQSSVPSSRNNDANRLTVSSIACRTYDSSKESNTQSSVVRLVYCGPKHHLQRLKTTFCMERKELPRGVKKKDVLFHPDSRQSMASSSVTSVLARVTRKLSTHAEALTCWQRTADWFVLRQFIITGTTGGFLANNDVETRKLLHRDPKPVVPLTDKEVVSKLRSSWVFRRGLSTSDMKSGELLG